MIAPKLLVHRATGVLYAYLGYNALAFRFGGQIRVVQVKRVWGPFYRRIGKPFFEGIEYYERPGGA